MVWPLLPLTVEGVLKPTLIAAAATAAGLWHNGRSPWWGLVAIPAAGLLCRVGRAIAGPRTRPMGRCSREDYSRRVRAVEEAAKMPGPLRMFKATTSNTFRPQQIASREQSQNRLDLSNFVHVLEVNSQEMWCDIEASATFETFVDETLKLGFAPLVVPELRTITVGGAIVGIGIESSSFRHGFFHEGLIECDILLASGKVVTLKPEGEHAELFRALPNSLGAFGYLLRLRMKIQRSLPLVKLEKVWKSSPEEFVEGLAAASKTDADFVDGVALGSQGGMVITARFVAAAPAGSPVRRYGLWPQFYTSLVYEGVEYLPTLDYFWRWDSDWFWCTQIFPGLTWRVVRWLCGPEILRSDMYKAFNDTVIKNVLEPLKLNKNEELVVQDIEIPLARSAEWIKSFLQVCPSLRIGKIRLQKPGLPQTVPIWLCPVKGTASPLMPMRAGELYINFGFWDALEGPETAGGIVTGNINRALEQLVVKFDGKKSLYSAAYFSEEEFYAQYNGDLYKRLKAQYDPNGRLRGWYERLTRQ